MPVIPQHPKKPCQDGIVRCPDCGYCPVELSAEIGTRLPQGMNEVELMLMEDQLDFFEVIGCDDGNIMCPECAREFPVPKLGQPVEYKAKPFGGGANL